MIDWLSSQSCFRYQSFFCWRHGFQFGLLSSSEVVGAGFEYYGVAFEFNFLDTRNFSGYSETYGAFSSLTIVTAFPS
jgi:hypothetical protein